MNGIGKLLAYITIFVLVSMIFIGIPVNGEERNITDNEITAIPLGAASGILDFDGDLTEWIEQEVDTATGSNYMLYNTYGGYWADAEKAPGSDGMGNPAPDNPGDEDDLLCWAATDANMLEWTGWGFVSGMDDTDEFFDYYIDHTTDYGSKIEYGLQWWFNGNLPSPGVNWSVEDVAGGNFWASSYTWTNYVLISPGNLSVLP
ncbi:MAG: hypothetical protein JSV49_11950 [Thermoplasmata archaeon]|nr:MAG: hypothetical protein JSV49_11950 [Thermoplasmata archaeon]